jgi:hypothetical protein
MENQVMQLPLYVKIVALVGAVLVVFILAAWELVNEWIGSAARAVVKPFRSGIRIRGRLYR